MDIRFPITLFALLLNVCGVMSGLSKIFGIGPAVRKASKEILSMKPHCIYQAGQTHFTTVIFSEGPVRTESENHFIAAGKQGKGLAIFYLDFEDKLGKHGMTLEFAESWIAASGNGAVCLVETNIERKGWGFFMLTHGPFHEQHVVSLLKLSSHMAGIIAEFTADFVRVDLAGIRNGANIAAQLAHDMKLLKSPQTANRLVAIDPANIRIPGSKHFMDRDLAKHVQVIITHDRYGNVLAKGHAIVRVKYGTGVRGYLKEDVFRVTAAKVVALIAAPAQVDGIVGRTQSYGGNYAPPQLDSNHGEYLVGIHTAVVDGADHAETLNLGITITLDVMHAIKPKK